MITEKLGKIAITPKGQYVAGSYERLDLVTDNGSSYLSLKDNNISSLDTADWMVVAEKGKAFEYSDFTPEQIALLQKPASDIATTVSNAEQLRATAETNRNNAEGLRLSAETTRGENEADRIEAEGLRAGAETDRNTAEGLRQQAELNRQTNTSTAISNAEQATEDANDAALLANEKAGLANNAATLANTKAGLADTAATNANTKAGLADAAATNANNVANGYAAELAAKELKANKQNSLAADGTGTKFPTVDAVNAGLNNLVASFTFNSNPEITINSVDTATDTITSTAHGLVNGNPICITQNNTSTQKVNPLTLFPGGTRQETCYVINATPNTFQISKTLGGAAIDITDNATMSLANIHIEKLSTKTINITQLPNLYEYRVLVNIKITSQQDSNIQIRPTWIANEQRWLSASNTVQWTMAGVPSGSSIGLVDIKLKMNNGRFNITSSGIVAKLTSPTNLGYEQINYSVIDLGYIVPRYINDILLTSTAPTHFILNGTSLQVYKL